MLTINFAKIMYIYFYSGLGHGWSFFFECGAYGNTCSLYPFFRPIQRKGLLRRHLPHPPVLILTLLVQTDLGSWSPQPPLQPRQDLLESRPHLSPDSLPAGMSRGESLTDTGQAPRRWWKSASFRRAPTCLSPGCRLQGSWKRSPTRYQDNQCQLDNRRVWLTSDLILRKLNKRE